MARYLLSHRHQPEECRFAYAAWRGFQSPLRHRPAMSSCAVGGHEVWWVVEAAGQEEALAHLPEYIACRTQLTEIQEVPIP